MLNMPVIAEKDNETTAIRQIHVESTVTNQGEQMHAVEHNVKIDVAGDKGESAKNDADKTNDQMLKIVPIK